MQWSSGVVTLLVGTVPYFFSRATTVELIFGVWFQGTTNECHKPTPPYTVALYVFLLQCMHMAFKFEIYFVRATPLLSFTKHLVVFGPAQGTTEQDEEIWWMHSPLDLIKFCTGQRLRVDDDWRLWNLLFMMPFCCFPCRGIAEAFSMNWVFVQLGRSATLRWVINHSLGSK